MNRLVLAAVLTALIPFNAIPQTPAEDHKRIRIAVDARDHAAAITELLGLELSDPQIFAAKNYDYLLARVAESDGDLALAMVTYQRVTRRDSPLRSYALFHLSRVARSTGNLMLEQLYLHQILLTSPESTLVGAARERLARNSFESANYVETIRILNSRAASRSIVKGQVSDTVRRDDLALLGEANLRMGRSDKARDIFSTLLATIPKPTQPDDIARTASLSLDLLDVGPENFGKKVPALPETEHLRRARIYQFNRDLANARLHYQAIITNYPMGQNVADAVLQIGRGYVQQYDFAEAAKWFERVWEQFPQHSAANEALLQAASAYGRGGKPEEAVSRYQKFIDSYPMDEKLDRAYLNIVDTLRDMGKDDEALKWCSKTQEVFAGRLPATLALFAEARIFIARDDWQNALRDLEKLSIATDLGGATVPGGTSTAEVTYLKAFVLEQMKLYAEAINIYLSIADGRGEYYGALATERLRGLAADEVSRSFAEQKLDSLIAGLDSKDADMRRKNAQAVLRMSETADLRETAIKCLRAATQSLPAYQQVPNFRSTDATREADELPQTVAGDLLYLGLYDEAAAELDAAMPNLPNGSQDAAYALATIYKRGDRADRATAFIEPLWRGVAADHPIELMPRDQLEMLYPTPYADVILRSAVERGVDPRFILAVMRQESRFQPDVKSYAAAYGLMQFISTTSNKIAGELGQRDFREDDLYYPPTAILFGSQYIADLFKQFPNQPDAVAASYNGGGDNMSRWLLRSRSSLPDRYVPEIAFSQTKDYVYKVMQNYRMYRYLYDETLRPR